MFILFVFFLQIMISFAASITCKIVFDVDYVLEPIPSLKFERKLLLLCKSSLNRGNYYFLHGFSFQISLRLFYVWFLHLYSNILHWNSVLKLQKQAPSLVMLLNGINCFSFWRENLTFVYLKLSKLLHWSACNWEIVFYCNPVREIQF